MMKRSGLVVLVVGMLLMGSQVASADEHPGVFSRTWSGVGGIVTTVIVVSHEILHVVGKVATAGMDLAHQGLEILGVPWTSHTE